jgi:hypothetical protein
MRALSGVKNPDKPNDAIINHPSVRKLLLFQKAVAEGGRSMIYECALMADEMRNAAISGDEQRADELDDRLGFLTPILKGFLTEKGSEAANCGIQVWGGHGFIKENFQEQIVRDIRIASVWEGTTQIQALDLLGRKLIPQKLKPIVQHCDMITKNLMKIARSKGHPSTVARAEKLIEVAEEWKFNTMKIVSRLLRQKDDIGKEFVGVASVDYLMYSGYIHLAYHWVMMEAAANKALDGENAPEEAAFYETKRQMSAYVFNELLPRTKSLEITMFTDVGTIMDIPVDNFSFDYTR